MPCHAMSSCHVINKPRQYGCQIEAYFISYISGPFICIKYHYRRCYEALKEEEQEKKGEVPTHWDSWTPPALSHEVGYFEKDFGMNYEALP